MAGMLAETFSRPSPGWLKAAAIRARRLKMASAANGSGDKALEKRKVFLSSSRILDKLKKTW